jgi:DNA-directed RNA polymerase specialized sigma24 family protein
MRVVAMVVRMDAVSVWPGRILGAQAEESRDDLDEERALVDLARQGDHLAFERLYERHAAAIHSFIRLRVGEVDIAREITQDVFLLSLIHI